MFYVRLGMTIQDLWPIYTWYGEEALETQRVALRPLVKKRLPGIFAPNSLLLTVGGWPVFVRGL